MQSDELAARGVRVKALVWEGDHEEFWADGYDVTFSKHHRGWRVWRYDTADSGEYLGCIIHPPPEAARAAAEVDHEARILAALEVSDE